MSLPGHEGYDDYEPADQSEPAIATRGGRIRLGDEITEDVEEPIGHRLPYRKRPRNYASMDQAYEDQDFPGGEADDEE